MLGNYLLILAFYLLASVGVQAQVINPDGLKEMWVNEYIVGKIYVSPDSNSYYHFETPPKLLRICRRDILTNELILQKDLKSWYYKNNIPEMAISTDGKYIAIPKKDTILVFDQQTFEIVKRIYVDLSIILEHMYDKESYELQGVKIEFLYELLFVSVDNKLVVSVRFSGDHNIPEEHRISGIAKALYNIDTGEFLNEYSFTKEKQISSTFRISPDMKNVLLVHKVDGEYPLVMISNEQFIDLIENESELTDYEIIAYDNFSSYYNFNIEGDWIYFTDNNINIYDLTKHEVIFQANLSKLCLESEIINKRYLTCNRSKISFYDIYKNKFYDLTTKDFGWYGISYIKAANYLIFQHTRNTPNTFGAYKFDMNIVDVKEPFEIIDTLYPNPTQEMISLETEKTYINYEITDLSGIIISEGIITNTAGGTITINISELASGTYFLSLFTETSVDTYQFIKIN